MDFIRNFPFFGIMLTMLAAIISLPMRGRAAKTISLTVFAIETLLAASVLIYTVHTGESFVYIMGHVGAPWGNELRAGVFEGLMAYFFSVVMLLSVSGGLKHLRLDIEESKRNFYFVMTDLLMGALLALIYTNDIFTAYVFIEISTIAACGILMIREIGRTTLAALRYMVFSLLGSGLFLIGIVLMYDLTGHLLMENMRLSVELLVLSGQFRIPLTVAISLMTLGMAIKSGLFPFHFWVPDTYGYSTPASGSILSGLVSKGYILILIKIYCRVIGWENLVQIGVTDILFVFGLAGMIVGSISAIHQNDIRRMVAFSSAAQIGYIYMGIGLGTQAGLAAACFHVLCHAVTKPLLFISASGLADASGGSKLFRDLQGSAYRNRWAGIAFTAGAFSMVGMPMFSGFISKLLFATAAVQVSVARMLPTLIVLAISTVLNAVYFLRTVIRIYTPAEQEIQGSMRIKWTQQRSYILVLLVFIALNLILGLFSQYIADAIQLGLSMFS
ncbi:MAG: sodium:proton antiporter [Clostridiaceae bacterium]|nr:sodium:proton antiporter [Clostridiaceae bacterium]